MFNIINSVINYYTINWFQIKSDDSEYSAIYFNGIDQKYNCDRKSHHGQYVFMCYSPKKSILVPVNPVGRTGLIGRGHLGRWGPNHAAGIN